MGQIRQTYLRIEPGASGIIHSKVLPGFWLDPEWLVQDPLPIPLEILRLIAGDALKQIAWAGNDWLVE